MIKVPIIDAGRDAFNYIAGGYQAPNQDVIQRFVDRVSEYSSGNDLLNNFIQRSIETIEQNKIEIDRIKQLKPIQEIKRMEENRKIYYIKNPEDFPKATFYMKRYILAQPKLRSLKYQYRCYGFEDEVIDYIVGYIDPIDHPDYKNVMDGVMVENNEMVEHVFYSDYTSLEYVDDDRLTPEEQLEIVRTWETVKMMVENKIDYTGKDIDEIG